MPVVILPTTGISPPSLDSPASGSSVVPSHLFFDGAGDYVEIPDNAAYSQPTTGGITVSLWIRPDVLDFSDTTPSADGPYINFCTKMTYVGGTKIEWLFRMYNLSSTRPNRISFYVFNVGGGTGIGSFFQDTVVAGEWIHLVGTIDATSTRIYKNGASRDTDVYTATITPADTTAPVRLGWGEDPTDGSFFQGGMDDLMIFSRALSPAEVTSLYGGVVPSGLVGRWRLDDGSGNTAIDDVAANNGTLHPGSGQPQWVGSPNYLTWLTTTDDAWPAAPVHFQVQVASDAAFSTLVRNVFSNQTPTEFEYESSPGTWTALPATGLAQADLGKKTRYRPNLVTLQQYFWRVSIEQFF
jgi:hypothetical protein